MFGSIGPWELAIVLLIALMVVGPGKLPDVARSIGKGLNEFKKVTTGVRKEFEDVMKEEIKPAPTVYKTDAVNPLETINIAEASQPETTILDSSVQESEKIVDDKPII